MAKSVKKIDPKAEYKALIMDIVRNALIEKGADVQDGANFGMTAGTIVVHGADFDLQLKPITTKAGVTRYTVAEVEG
jgi:hypothetical protein